MKIKEKADHILRTPLLNKGLSFSQKERDELGLNGLLPCKITDVNEQIERNYKNFQRKRTPLGKYEFLTALLNRNEILFYQFAQKYVEEILQYIYTPTVGEAALHYSIYYHTRRGLYLSYPLKDKMDSMFDNIPNKDIEVVVVTDGERILGLGDQGIGGITISIGKLILYSLFGGFHPSKTLPIILDVGTNNELLLKSDFYLGYRKKRIRGKEYDRFVDQFVKTLQKRFPNALLQWEDFGKENARPLLLRYQDKLLSFNDDIQGTAMVAVAAILAAVKKNKQKLTEQKIVIFGGGSAGMGIAEGILQVLQSEGLSQKEAFSKIYIIDVHGLVHTNLKKIEKTQKPFAKPYLHLKKWDLKNIEYISLSDVVQNVNSTILIGVSAQGGAFSEEIIRCMAKKHQHPIIFPLSNPTFKAEATPEEIFKWTKGKAIVATGSPFPPVEYKGKAYEISQCNNVYIFPGIGLGATVAKAKKITSNMFLAAAKTLASLSPSLKDPYSPIFPNFQKLQSVSKKIALSVAKQAIKDKVSPIDPKTNISSLIDKKAWKPHYDRFSH